MNYINKHFIVYEESETLLDYGCIYTTTYYTFEGGRLDNYSLVGISIAIYEYLGYSIPEHLEEDNERADYAETMLNKLGVTWEIKQED